MKKVLSILLAALFVCALCVPAFAGTIDQDSDPQSGQTVVKVDTSNMPENGEWEVTYPAEIDIEWGAQTTAVSDYSIKTHLAVGKKLVVSVAKHADYAALKYADKTLAYTLSGETSVTLGEVETKAPAVTIGVTENSWNTAPIAAYQGYLTFTAEVQDA